MGRDGLAREEFSSAADPNSQVSNRMRARKVFRQCILLFAVTVSASLRAKIRAVSNHPPISHIARHDPIL